MSKLITWRALRPCVAGGAYREAGEVFQAPDGDYAKDVREKVGDQDVEVAPVVDPATKTKNAKAKDVPGVTPEDLPSNDV